MSKIGIILLLISIKSYSQDTAYFKTWNETGVQTYFVQNSSDGKNWNNYAVIAPLKKDTNVYNVSLPLLSGHWRINTQLLSGTYFPTKDTLLNYNPVNNATVTSAAFKNSWFTDKLNFSILNETGVNYYQIDKSKNSGKNWTKVTTITSTFAGSYYYSLTRILASRPLYAVTIVYSNGSKSNKVLFN